MLSSGLPSSAPFGSSIGSGPRSLGHYFVGSITLGGLLWGSFYPLKMHEGWETTLKAELDPCDGVSQQAPRQNPFFLPTYILLVKILALVEPDKATDKFSSRRV